MKWGSGRPPREWDDWHPIFAYAPHRCTSCNLFFWWEVGERRYHTPINVLNVAAECVLVYFRCTGCARAAVGPPPERVNPAPERQR